MIIGVPKEIKNHEYRVGLTPSSAYELIKSGHSVLIEKKLGNGIDLSDDEYVKVGAKLVNSAKEVFDTAQMIVKVKEPQEQECKMLQESQILFTYLHLAPDPLQTKLLVESKCVGIAYETITDNKGGLPLLAPMSEVAGSMSIQAGAQHLEKSNGGRGILLPGVPGIEAGKVTVIGGGVSGMHAAKVASGIGAEVTILEKSLDRIRYLDDIFQGKIRVLHSNQSILEKYVIESDLVVTAVLIAGAAAPKLISRELLKRMKKGSVIVDIAIDQGGCLETSKITTHANPTFVEEGVIHYCVANMPGAVARSSSYALNNATLPFALDIANKGWKKALLENHHLLNGLNVLNGKITCEPVAQALGYKSYDAKISVEEHAG